MHTTATNPVPEWDRSYSYDRAGRLTRVDDRTGSTTGGVCTTRTYTFDPNGNRTGQTSATGTPGQECPDTGAATISREYDAADRPVTGGNAHGAYVYDELGRQLTIPATDTPHPGDGDITLGYYDTDAARTITQGSITHTFSLDVAGRRLTDQHTTVGETAQLDRHYTDASDNPGWSLDVRNGVATTTRYASGIAGDLGITYTTKDGQTTVEAALASPRGHINTTITIPATGNVEGINTWNDYTEYGTPTAEPSTTAGGTTGIGYGWHGTAERATTDTGLTLMGARLYAASTGHFTSPDPVYGGNETAYLYPGNPIDASDLDGRCMGGSPQTSIKARIKECLGAGFGNPFRFDWRWPKDLWVKWNARSWDKGSFSTRADSLRYHFSKHGGSFKGVRDYTVKAKIARNNALKLGTYKVTNQYRGKPSPPTGVYREGTGRNKLMVQWRMGTRKIVTFADDR